MCACKKENERGQHLLSPKEHMHSGTFPHPANTCLFEWSMRQVQQWMWRTRGRHQEPVTCWFGLLSLRKCQHITGSQLGKCIPGREIQCMCERSVDPESLDFAEGCNFCCRAQRVVAKVRVGYTESTQGFKLRSPFFSTLADIVCAIEGNVCFVSRVRLGRCSNAYHGKPCLKPCLRD